MQEMFETNFKEETNKIIENFKNELNKIVVGKVNTQVVSKLQINYFGEKMSLDQLVSIASPQPQQLVLKPYDPKTLDQIHELLKSTNLDCQIQKEGNQIRLVFAMMTEEKRKEIIKGLVKLTEGIKVKIRLVRQNVNKNIKADKTMNENQNFEMLKKIQTLTDECIKIVSDLNSNKEKQLMII